MRILYLLVFFLLFPEKIISQTILNQPENSSRTVQDSISIILTNGFHAKAKTNQNFLAQINKSTELSNDFIDSKAGAENPSGTVGTGYFHDTQGNIEVNGSGQLQFTLPIALPPGVKSVAPQINLVYTSGSGNGIAGYGWNLSGITSISRMGKTIEKDGEVKGIQLDYSDYYSFNGQRLILKSGQYGKDGAEYTTEKFSNVKIKSVGNLTDQPWKGPEYWEVTFEDGSEAWYGNTASGSSLARTPIEYNIVKWKDTQGNYITYNYTQNSNVAVISSILWGGNETQNTLHFNRIEFIYNNRALKEFSSHRGIDFIQDKLLKDIIVKTNIDTSENWFKKYSINYEQKTTIDNDAEKTIAYNFVNKITEYSSNGDTANPIIFSTRLPSTSIYEKSFVDFESVHLTGDYNGDGLVDFILKEEAKNGKPEGYYLYFDKLNNETSSFLYLGKSEELKHLTNFTFKPSDNILNPYQGLVTVKNIYDHSNPQSNGAIEIKVFSINTSISLLNTFNSALVLEYSKFIDPSDYKATTAVYPTFPPANYGYYIKSQAISPKEIDINSDGISELIFTLYDKGHYRLQSPYPYEWTSVDLGYRYIIIDQDDFTSNTFTTINNPTNTNALEEAHIMDFDKDGRQDILNIERPNFNNHAKTNVTFYTKNRYDNSDIKRTINVPINIISRYNIIQIGKFGNNKYILQLKNKYSIKGLRNEIKFGDLNGDGNIEIFAPLERNLYDSVHNAGWSFYLNNGKTLSEFCQGFIEYYNSAPVANGYYQKSQIGVIDIDNDGKSDILHFYAGYNTQRSGNFSNIFLFRASEFKYDQMNTKFKWSWTFSTPFKNHKGGSSMFPIFGDFKINNNNFKIIFLSQSLTNSNDKKIISYQSYNIEHDKRIKSITQGGIKTEIEYKELDPTKNPEFYKPIKKEQYPFLELDKASQSYAVSQLRQTIPINGINVVRKQDFRYRGLVTHLHGKGMLGFRQSARSSWYTDGFANTKIWSGTEMNPLAEGVPIKEWSIKTNDENQIFPANITLANTQLLSLKLTEYKTEYLVNGVKKTTITNAEKPKAIMAMVPISSISKDVMQDIKTVDSIEYNEHYLPTKTISKINDGFATKTTSLEYYPPNLTGTGNQYHVGRPKNKTELMQAYGDSKGVKEDYTYENNLLKTKTSWNRNNSGWIRETYTYDGFGNITQKILSNSTDAQTKTSTAQYENKGRFAIKKNEISGSLNLETKISYNNWGQILTETDAFGNTITNTYDAWGKPLTTKHNLSGTTSYLYEKLNNGDAKITQTNPDGSANISYTNKLGQNYKTTTKGFGSGNYVSKTVKYDDLGRKTEESEPYTEGTTPTQWNKIIYDDFSRPVKAISFTGKIVENTYNGRTTTATETNANNRFRKQTTDALGNTISSEDKGGIILFKYNAAGENTEAKYGTNIVTTKYDVWGRKSEFYDPSNGRYRYEYKDGFGKITKEISPKGYKQYTYNASGQLTSQKEQTTDGTKNTEKNIIYTYNNKGLLTAKQGTSKGSFFSTSIAYDRYGRLLSNTESSYNRYYTQKGIIYDALGRVSSYEKQLYSSGIQTSVVIENVYHPWSGELYQVKDKTTGKTLWELGQTDASGRIIKARLGAVGILNIYDQNGFLSNTNHSTQAKTILQVGYSFNAIKNELNSRNTGGDLNILENFTYDDNNRLVNWTNPISGQMNHNVYDKQGRITQNDQVGSIKFENNQFVYRPTSVVLNRNGERHLFNNLIQKITYNENNDPAWIDGQNGDVRFEYGLTQMRQKVTYGGNFITSAEDGGNTEGNFTKYYNEDGSFEVTRDNRTGEEKHILYIGGSPYEANIVYLKNFKEHRGSYKFLHKDYLGSILAISDEAGNKVEQRHYDAWGYLTHGKMELIDRGYTSHEHFAEVGIIHMNGRLYDPLLRRFLNADENIQDMYNTQNYNKYGYVLNNPLMYNDPSGEFIWFVVGAVIGAYITGAQANGTLNPFKWNWSATWGKIALGAVFGTISGGVGAMAGSSAAVFAASAWNISGGVLGGAIAGLAGGAVGGAVSGFGNAVIFGESVGRSIVRGLVAGAIGGAVIGGVAGGVQQGFSNAKVTTTGVGTKGNIWTGREIAAGRSAWALNNTAKVIPKSTTLGQTSKGTLKIGDITVDQEITTYKINPTTESIEEVKSSYTRFINTEDGTTIDLQPTIDRIKSGGAFPHRNDGSVFQNFPPRGQVDPLLPIKPQGFYKEFVVPTPGINGPGAMRMVTGSDGSIWFTRDHYGSFIKIFPR